ncbi:MAG: hypothetical protein ACKVE4_07905 [Dissulfuribacterales bacterium]
MSKLTIDDLKKIKEKTAKEPSLWRRPQSSFFGMFWTPAYAGVTDLGLFTIPSKGNCQKFYEK